MISYKELEYLIEHFGFNKDQTSIMYKTDHNGNDMICFIDKENRLEIHSNFIDSQANPDYQIENRMVEYYDKTNDDHIQKPLNKIMKYYDDNGFPIKYNIKKYGRVTAMRKKNYDNT